MINRIEGNQIYLREIRESDASLEYCSWLNNPEVTKYLETHSQTIAQLKSYIVEKTNKIDCIFLGIFVKNSNLHIGTIKLEPVDYLKRKAVLGILIGNKDYWGQGIGAEAINILIDWSFKKLRLREIELGVIIENSAAVRLYKKCGFVVKMKKNLIRGDGKRAVEIVMNRKNRAYRSNIVSIVIRAYNCEKFIDRSIESALSQNFNKNDYEIIVINDGSKDATWQKLQKYGKNKNVFLFDQKNRGPIESANLGFLMSTGKYVTLLDCDDSLEKTFLIEMISALNLKKDFDFAYCDYFEKFDDIIVKVQPRNIFETVAMGTIFLRRKLIEVGLYSSGVGFAEYDLLLRTGDKWHGLYVEDVLFTYNRSQGSLTSSGKSVRSWLNQLKKLHPNQKNKIDLIRSYDVSNVKKRGRILLRPATSADSRFFLNLRNLKQVRKWSFTDKIIDLKTHNKWFIEKLNSKNSSLFVLVVDNKIAGQIRFDLMGKTAAIINIAVLPSFQSKGYGQFMTKTGCKLFVEKFPQVRKFVAIVKSANLKSAASFSKVGFKNKGSVSKNGVKSFKFELKI